MHIVYFDGHCNVCNRFIDFLIRHDKNEQLFYAPLQGETASRNLPQKFTHELSTIVFVDGDRLSIESTAALNCLIRLGGVFHLLKIFFLIPRFIRDAVYRGIANHRDLFAGRSKTCRIPSPAEQKKFLK